MGTGKARHRFFPQYEQWCLDSVTYGREGRRKMGPRTAHKLNARKVQETVKILIRALGDSFGVNWPVHTWLWPWGLSSDFHSSPLHCFFHCSTFWHFISSLDLQNIANLVLITTDFDFSILEQNSQLIYIRILQKLFLLIHWKPKKGFRTKISTGRSARDLCSTVLNKLLLSRTSYFLHFRRTAKERKKQ